MREERGSLSVVVYGKRAVLEALACASVEVEEVRVDGGIAASMRKEVASAARSRGVGVDVQDRRGVTALSGDSRNDQGVAARVRLTGVMDAEQFVDSLKGRGAQAPAHVIALDGVTNPQNIGMVVRSVVASGARAMLWPTVGSPWVNGLIIKSSAATVYRCPIVLCGALEEGLGVLRDAGFRVYGLDAKGEEGLFGIEPRHRSVFVLGSETEGMTPGVRAMVEEGVRIPMEGGAESLNVAVAAGLVCFELMRARGFRG